MANIPQKPPDSRKETSLEDVGSPHYTRVDRKRPNPILQPNSPERGHLSRDPNWNQAGNERGSGDNGDGSQTGGDLIE